MEGGVCVRIEEMRLQSLPMRLMASDRRNDPVIVPL
jgi:hypothetical protein